MKNHLSLAGALILALFAVATSCGDGENVEKRQLVERLEKDVERLTARLHEARSGAYTQARKLRELQEQLARKTEDGTATERDKKQVDDAMAGLDGALDTLMQRMADLERNVGGLARAKGETPSKVTPKIDEEEVEDPIEDPGTLDGEESTGSGGTAGPSNDAESELDDATKDALKAAGAMVCAANPALCPFVGALAAVLDLFGSTEERNKVLGIVKQLASGGELTSEQKSFLKNKVVPKLKDMPPGLLELLDPGPEGDPEVSKAIAGELERQLERVPVVKALRDALKEEARAGRDYAGAVKRILEGQSVTSELKQLVLVLARQVGVKAKDLEKLKRALEKL